MIIDFVLLIHTYIQVNGHGIESMSKLFLDFGYTEREELSFPKKKLKALWFSPPTPIHGPSLPRIFISELLVDQMSPQAQVICVVQM